MNLIFDAEPPLGTEALAVPWVRMNLADDCSLPAAVVKPLGTGPFPTVLLFHGSHGFAHEYVGLARDLAVRGFLAIAVGWFREGAGPGLRFVRPIHCPDAPERPDPLSPAVVHLVHTVVEAARSLPQVHSNRLALFGHSRGGGAVLNYILRTPGTQAAVLSSSRFPASLLHLCTHISTPILMLHGTDDRPEDGGTEFTNVAMAHNFENALRSAGKQVDAVYYPGGRHNDIFANKRRYSDELEHISAFLRCHLMS